LQCVLELQSDHAQYGAARGASGYMSPRVQALEARQHTLFRHLKNEFFSGNLGQKYA